METGFPCCLCDHLSGVACSADVLGRDIKDIPVCPLAETSMVKPDIGCWVVRQPNGLFCYYNEKCRRVEAMDMTLEEVILYRERTCGMPHPFAEKDTLAQVKHRVFRWEDVTR